MIGTRTPALLCGVFVCACSAPVLDADVAAGEAAERDGDYTRALAAYDKTLARCDWNDPPPSQRQLCVDVYLARAGVFDAMGRRRDAALAYERAPQYMPWSPVGSAMGVYRAGRLYLEMGDATRGYQLLWRTVTFYPEQGFAGDALEVVIRDGKKRNVEQLYEVLGELLQPLADTAVADNVLYALADLAENEFSDMPSARAQYDKIAIDYPQSTMRDDALWHAARLSRLLGDARGAIDRLRQLLSTREVAFGTGSYFSVWLDNAQLELGRILRDDLSEFRAALDAFTLLPKHYPASVFRDDALWESALTWDRMGERERTCQTLARLAREWPDSKHELKRAPALRHKRGCAPVPTSE